MITIKKTFWILISLLVVALLIFSFTTIKKQFAMKQIKEIHTQEKEGKIEETEPEEAIDEEKDDAPEEEPETAEDPVREYLSEKVSRAIKPFFKNDIKITAIGDSLTQGVGDEADNGGYVGILEDTINQDKDLIDIKSFGKRGNRSDQLIERMKDPEIEEALIDSDIILITIGANDIMQIFKENFTDLKLNQFALGKANYESRLHYIFSDIEKDNPRADIYLIGFYNPFKKYFADIAELEMIINNWNALGEEITGEYDQVTFIPTKDLFEDTSINYFSEDNFHPNHLGYELMAERVLEYIVNEEEESDEQEE